MGKGDFATGQLEKSLFSLVAVPVSLMRTAFEFLFQRRRFQPRIAGAEEQPDAAFPIMSPLAYLALAYVVPGLTSYLVSQSLDGSSADETGSLPLKAAAGNTNVESLVDMLTNPTIAKLGMTGIWLSLMSALIGLLMTAAAAVVRVKLSFVVSWSLAAYATGTFALIIFGTQILTALQVHQIKNDVSSYPAAALAFSPIQLSIIFFAASGLVLLGFAYAHQLRKTLGIGRLQCLGILGVFLIFVAIANVAMEIAVP